MDLARVAAIFAVVMLHVSAYGVTGTPVGSGDWWVANVADSAVRWCVPVLVMVSGALLLHPDKQAEPPRVFVRKRLQRVLLPLVFWTGVYTLWNQRALALTWDARLGHALEGMARGAPHYHLWFLYMIVLLYAFVPALRAMAAAASLTVLKFTTGAGFVLAAIAAVHAASSGAPAGLFTHGFLSYLPYFLAGHLIAISAAEAHRWKLAAVVGASVVATAWGCHALTVSHQAAAGQYFYGYLSLTVIPMSVAAAVFFRSLPPVRARWLQKLGPLTLGIYLVHPLLLESAQGLWPKLLDGPQWLVIPAVTAALLVGSTVVTALLARLPLTRRFV